MDLNSRIYKDGAKTGKSKKLFAALVGIGGVIGVSAYGLLVLQIPFLPLQTFTIIGVFLVGFSTFGEIKGIPMWRFFYLAMRYAVSENKRNFVLETKKGEKKASEKGKTKIFKKKKSKKGK